MNNRAVEFIKTVQSLLDEGNSRNNVASILNVHHSKIDRLLDRGEVEVYEAFDELQDRTHLYQNFEWLWEEDWLEELCNKAFEDRAILDKHKDKDTISIGKYVREKYGTLKRYLSNNGKDHLQDFILITCPSCEGLTPLSKWYERDCFNWGLFYECPSCRKEMSVKYNKKHPERLFRNNTKRREMANALPGSYIKDDWISVRKEFNWRCAFTFSDTFVTVDHFIPVNIGHGGTFEGNLVPLIKELNSSKKEKNPFDWAATKKISEGRFGNVVSYLSKLNVLTPNEYWYFVNWCFDNRRTLTMVYEDKRHSIELWREATGRHFPLPKYAMNKIGNCSTDELTVAMVDGKEER